MKKKICTLLLCLCPLLAMAQAVVGITGQVVDDLSGKPVQGVTIVLRDHNLNTRTNTDGVFEFRNIRPGNDMIALSASHLITKEIAVVIKESQFTDLGTITMVNRQIDNTQALVGVIDDNDLIADNDENTSQDISSMVIFSNDIYLNNAGYQFSQFRFRTRGYENRYAEKYINGVSFNEQVRGVFSYASIGALNDLTRNGDAVNYFAPSTFSFGTIGGAENINMRAGSYTQGGKATASYTNRSYYLRGMASYSTGMQENGWAVTALIGGRYSDEGNVDGVFYNNLSYALAVEKEFDNGRQSIAFTTFGSPVKRGQQGSSYQEVYNLTGDNLYNPNWGYQHGKKRNSRVVRSFDPTAILSHTWKINEYTTLVSGLGVHYNRYGGTALNWYNGPDPRPDYYRYLPSYNEANELAYEYYTYLWKSGRTAQLDWDGMWEANYINNMVGNGSAIYMLEERRKDLGELAFNSTLNTRLSERVKLTAGVGLKHSYANQFKTVKDLLGATYLLDVDKYSERDYPGDSGIKQNDLNRPDRKVYKGDVFGYDFRFLINAADAWLQQTFKYQHIDFYYGARLKYTEFQRKGKMRNGRYASNSFGEGKKHRFVDHALKAGMTYKFSGRHFVSGNVAYQTMAPLVDNAYISPRITDQTTDGLKSVGIFSADLSYIFSLPSLTGRVSVFNTNFFNDLKRIGYYHDGERTFVNHVVNGIRKVHRGVELGANYKLNEHWNFDLAGTVSEYYYSNNPMGEISYENGKAMEANNKERVYLKNSYLGGTPQVMGTLGINFFYNYWFVSMNVNGFARNYVETSPLRRLASNYTGVTPPGTNGFDETVYNAYRKLTHQERFGSGYTVDLSIGKIFYLPNRNSINFNFSLNNLFNRENVRTGGYEQGRISTEYPDRFGSKYYYMQGINCFANVSYRF